MFQAKYPIILASGSPRRQQFLRELGLDFEVRTSLAEEQAVSQGKIQGKALGKTETESSSETPAAYAQRLARLKALAVGSCVGKLIIAADTIVVLEPAELRGLAESAELRGLAELGNLVEPDDLSELGLANAKPLILGKPKDEAEALRMLQLLAGKVHTVITAVSLILPQGQELGFYQSSQVQFRAWPKAVLAAYAHTKEPLDKAGGYAIQGQGSFLVATIEGSWSNVVGLPMAELVAKLLEHDLLVPRL